MIALLREYTRLPVRVVGDLHEVELDPFRNLKDRHVKARDGLFVAEGREVVRRLLQSSLDLHSLLLTPGKYEQLKDCIGRDSHVFVADLDQIESIAGFNVHRGALACGYRPANPNLRSLARHMPVDGPIVAMENITDAQNVGVIIRNAAAFGAPFVILASCCDPFYRRSIRVSMGNVFRLPVYVSDDLSRDLEILKHEYGIASVATVLSSDAIPLRDAAVRTGVVLVFGAEGYGLSDEVIAACSERVTIPMSRGTDSVNVSVASGVFLHHYADGMRSG